MVERIIKLADRIIQTGLILLVLLVPTAIWLRTTDVAVVKVTITQLLVLIMLAAWLIKMIEEGRIKLTKTPLNYPILAFLMVGVISFIRSPYPHTSLRELTRLLTYGAIFFIVANNLKSRRQVKYLLTTILVVTIPISIYGILQRFGIDFIPREGAVPLHERVISTFGHHNFIAVYLILTMSLTAGIFTVVTGKYKRVALGALIILMFLTFRYCYSRGGWLGFLAALLVFGSLYLSRLEKVKMFFTKRKLIILVSILILFSLMTLLLGRTLFEAKIAEQLAAVRGAAIKSRIFIYSGSIGMIKERPLLGFGIGTFSTFYPEYRPLEHTTIHPPQEISIRHAHSEYLEIGVEMGLLGLATFFWILISFFRRGLYLFHSMPDKHEQGLLLGCLAGTMGILATNLVSVNLRFVSSAVFFWFTLGLTMALGKIYKKDNIVR